VNLLSLPIIFPNLGFQGKSLAFACFSCENLYCRPISETTLTPRGVKLIARLISENLQHKLALSLRFESLQSDAFIEIWASTLKSSPLITFLKKPIPNQWRLHESESSMMRHPKGRPSQPLRATCLQEASAPNPPTKSIPKLQINGTLHSAEAPDQWRLQHHQRSAMVKRLKPI